MDQTILLTFRLHGSIPASTGRELKAGLRAAQEAVQAQADAGASPAETAAARQRAQKAFFAKYDAVLDRAPSGPRYFELEQMAEVLAGEIMMLEETGFTVHGFAILPNHAHAVLHLPARSSLSLAKSLDLLHLRSATACRRLVRPRLPPEAEFWQAGWHEYAVQDEVELARLLAYLKQQAQKAGLPARFSEWPYIDEVIG
ncbi:hypothetical protein GCM10023185_02700 [Hymenobacter saemangeumensis]|uniref:Transposase IS200-like domain-containing protein n=1 Tax=Hymenobacter saemangeumensis TaxID=1084522 RepID=A0ABP8HYR9_9BACT